MITFINDKTINFCQITLRIKRFIHERKVVPFFCLMVYTAFNSRAGFKGGRQTGQLPRASTTKGPPQKTVKNYYLKKHKILFGL